ncbi:hypothetical protein M8C21_029715, partial [Ambrosia artemisiifolia]
EIDCQSWTGHKNRDSIVTMGYQIQHNSFRERADRPFRCLDRQYRRELVRICCRFVEDKRGRLGKLIEDKARWS